jgi:broad specificity phosphatase PhoE
MAEKEVSQRMYVMRHGERLDSIDRQWTKRAARPYDTPLSRHGEHEAMRLVKQRLTNKVKLILCGHSTIYVLQIQYRKFRL